MIERATSSTVARHCASPLVRASTLSSHFLMAAAMSPTESAALAASTLPAPPPARAALATDARAASADRASTTVACDDAAPADVLTTLARFCASRPKCVLSRFSNSVSAVSILAPTTCTESSTEAALL